MRISNHLNTLRRLGLRDYVRYLFLKHLDPFSADVLYTRRACEELFKTGINMKMRRSVVLKGYLVIVSPGEIESGSFVARREELEILRRFFTGALNETFCEKIYHMEDPSSYDLLIDIGSTLGEDTGIRLFHIHPI